MRGKEREMRRRLGGGLIQLTLHRVENQKLHGGTYTRMCVFSVVKKKKIFKCVLALANLDFGTCTRMENVEICVWCH